MLVRRWTSVRRGFRVLELEMIIPYAAGFVIHRHLAGPEMPARSQ
jgi:hypothetical protein